MNLDSIRKYIPNIFRLLSIAVILGTVYGLFFAILHVYNNEYLNNEVYNIILFDIKSYVTEYVLLFILISAGVILIYGILTRIFQTKRLKVNNLHIAVLYSLTFIVIFALIFYSSYPEIISLLKSTPLAESLRRLTKSREETRGIFIIIVSVAGLIFFILSTYMLSKSSILDVIHHRLIRIADSGVTKSLGFALIAVVLILNIFVYEYKKINSPSGPNIVLISIDTLRADHIGSYGHKRDTTPNIDKLAEKGILFENAYSQGPWTYPSMSSMHTSLYPSQIGINNFDVTINDSHMTLAEYMKNNFYNTHAVIANIVISKPLGFSQGFDTFDQDSIREHFELSSHIVSDKAIEYLSGKKGSKFFLWLHYMDPHSNYIHHPEYNYSEGYSGSLGDNLNTQTLNKQKELPDEEDLIYIKNLYDEEISFTDHQIGRVLDYLSELGLSDNTIIIITADHGDEFLERTRFGHSKSLYQELIHVPLIIYVPSDKEIGSKRVQSNVEVRSITRTILDLCGIRGNRMQGSNLLITAENSNFNSYAFSQKTRNNNYLETIIAGNWKLIKNVQDDRYELYDLESDPGERTNLFDSSENGLDNVKKELISKLTGINKERIGKIEEVDFKEEDIQKLKALGYIQ